MTRRRFSSYRQLMPFMRLRRCFRRILARAWSGCNNNRNLRAHDSPGRLMVSLARRTPKMPKTLMTERGLEPLAASEN
jgi:hypothetical protein